MIGREKELEQLERLCARDRFEFLVMYGRRRVGKTTILQEFSNSHNVIFYSAQEKNDSLNLQDFSKMIQQHFDGQWVAPFLSWEDAFSYVTRKTADQKTILIIDEFPFMAGPNPSIKSMLQHEIDHHWKDRNIFLIFRRTGPRQTIFRFLYGPNYYVRSFPFVEKCFLRYRLLQSYLNCVRQLRII